MPRSEPGAPWPLVRHGLRNVTPWAGSTTPPGSNTNPCSRPGNTAHNGAPPEPEGPGRYPSSQPFPQPCPHTYHHSVVPQTKARASSSLWRKARAGSPPGLLAANSSSVQTPGTTQARYLPCSFHAFIHIGGTQKNFCIPMVDLPPILQCCLVAYVQREFLYNEQIGSIHSFLSGVLVSSFP